MVRVQTLELVLIKERKLKAMGKKQDGQLKGMQVSYQLVQGSSIHSIFIDQCGIYEGRVTFTFFLLFETLKMWVQSPRSTDGKENPSPCHERHKKLFIFPID